MLLVSRGEFKHHRDCDAASPILIHGHLSQLHQLADPDMILPHGIEKACKGLLIHGDGSDALRRNEKMVQDYRDQARRIMLCLSSPIGEVTLQSKVMNTPPPSPCYSPTRN
jgi:hypothetical protein